MESELKTQISQAAIEKIKSFKQDHLLEVLPLIKDAKELHDYISTIENIDYALLEQVFFLLILLTLLLVAPISFSPKWSSSNWSSERGSQSKKPLHW